MSSICGECGVIATKSASCVHCGSQAPRVEVADRADDTMWVCIECTFKCRMCGFRVPINGLDMDGAVICAKCSLEQAFDVEQWRVIFEEAHATGDLWGDRAGDLGAVIDAQYFDLGKVNASLAFNGAGENAVNTLASPGRPLCEKCHAPLNVNLDAAPRTGRVSTTCACGETASYEAPAAARKMSEPLTAVVCSEHRSDRKDVRVDATDSAIAVRCPGCDAPLSADGETKFVTCSYCNTQARIPDRTWFKLSKKEHVPEKMWMLFHGPSGTRQSAGKKKLANDESSAEQERSNAKRHAREVFEATAAEADRIQNEKKHAEYLAEVAYNDAEQTRRRAESKHRERVAQIVVGGGFALGMIVFAVYQVQADAKRHADESAYKKTILNCSPQFPEDCMKTAAASIANNSGDAAIDDYETACNAGYHPACDAVEALVLTPKVDVSGRLNHYERYCTLGKLVDCNLAGSMYANANGDGLGKDESAASKLFKKSCDGGNQSGCDLLTQSCKRGVKESCPATPDAGHRH